MPDTASPTHLVLPEHSQRYCRLTRGLLLELSGMHIPGGPADLARPLSLPGADPERAIDRLMVDLLTHYGYGLIRHAPSQVRWMLTTIATLYSQRANGIHVGQKIWDAERCHAADFFEELLDSEEPGNVALMAARGAYLATDPTDWDVPATIAALAVQANAAVGDVAHTSVINWLLYSLITRTTATAQA